MEELFIVLNRSDFMWSVSGSDRPSLEVEDQISARLVSEFEFRLETFFKETFKSISIWPVPKKSGFIIEMFWLF